MYLKTLLQGEDPLAVTLIWYSTGRVTARYLKIYIFWIRNFLYVGHILVTISCKFIHFTHILHSVAKYARNWVHSMVYRVKLMIN